MWEIYNRIIEGIPSDIEVIDTAIGTLWTAVKTHFSCGIGEYPYYDTGNNNAKLKMLSGANLRDLAEYVKSWNLIEAAIGQAAINAWYCSPQFAPVNGIDLLNFGVMENRLNDPFISYQNKIKGKNVVIIGHFHFLEQLFKPFCGHLAIINQDQVSGDYPRCAMEYLLPEANFVIMTAQVFSDKRLMGILELCPNAHKIMVDPGTPLCPVLFEYGIHDLSGFIVTDFERGFKSVTGDVTSTVYGSGCKVSIKRKFENS